jgi:mRNA-degrading endonuclease RelE of RelBE toxin-antitoxin system
MKKFKVIIPKPVQKQWYKIPEPFYRKIIKKVLLLEDNPRLLGSIKI